MWCNSDTVSVLDMWLSRLLLPQMWAFTSSDCMFGNPGGPGSPVSSVGSIKPDAVAGVGQELGMCSDLGVGDHAVMGSRQGTVASSSGSQGYMRVCQTVF